MSVALFGTCAAVAFAVANPVPSEVPAAVKPTAKADAVPNVSHTYLGEVTGSVVKVGDGSITLKVTEVVQTGTTHKKMASPHVPGMSGGHRSSSIAVPKLGTKMVEMTFDLSDAVTVKTVTGKAMTLADVTANGAVRVHVERVREVKPGEKTEPRLVVKSIDVPVPAAVVKK
jgi:hypothetical protein